jgi:putative ubiquitin-RnfH superfamily antitoxin RatB of RatAB toxin-antitoxin module
MDKQVAEIAFATADKQVIVPVTLDKDVSTVQQLIDKSRVLEQFPGIDLKTMGVGIFSKPCQLETVVKQGDRVEIYRSLLQHPMDARRKRAAG